MELTEKTMGEMMGKMISAAMVEMPRLVKSYCQEGGWPEFASKIMDIGDNSADMWEGMMPTWIQNGLGKVLPHMEKERVFGLARLLISTVVEESSPYMSEEASKSLMGSTWGDV